MQTGSGDERDSHAAVQAEPETPHPLRPVPPVLVAACGVRAREQPGSRHPHRIGLHLALVAPARVARGCVCVRLCVVLSRVRITDPGAVKYQSTAFENGHPQELQCHREEVFIDCAVSSRSTGPAPPSLEEPPDLSVERPPCRARTAGHRRGATLPALHPLGWRARPHHRGGN